MFLTWKTLQVRRKPGFCFGEDVYLDGTGSSGETSYYISVERLPGGGYYTLSNNPGGMIPGTVGYPNLTQAFAAKGLYFVPGNEYRVKLALQNTANCISWTEQTINFNMGVQPGSVPHRSRNLYLTRNLFRGQLPTFSLLRITKITSSMGLKTSYVLSAPAPGGPYTLLSVQSGSIFLCSGNRSDLLFVVRRLITPCGELCFGRSNRFPGFAGGECGSERSELFHSRRLLCDADQSGLYL